VWLRAGYLTGADTVTSVVVPGGPQPGLYCFNIQRDSIEGIDNRRRIYHNANLLIDESLKDGGNSNSPGENGYLFGVNNANVGAFSSAGVQFSMYAITSSVFSDAEHLDFYQTVRDYLIIPFGRN
jgi:hypothetical protein